MPCRWSEGPCDVRKCKSHSVMVVVRRCRKKHAHVRERSGRQSFVADLISIISAAHKLPAEVDPPARVWASLHAQLEREGILGRSVKALRTATLNVT